ncbi:MAG: stress response translation initiation inhibitor YciH [Candidatus Aenigmarchaeota archaeon]|jgi:translation initiation factor 1|nr:stress response translation initiation inhibitor YciH [Candidatus Aenigmarchaeota archaeon]
MSEVCPNCGLPKELCVCETIAKESEKIRILEVKKRYGKISTIVQGMSKDVDTKSILKELKTRLACGGTIKDGVIELQGKHREKVKAILVKLGFKEDQIEVG